VLIMRPSSNKIKGRLGPVLGGGGGGGWISFCEAWHGFCEHHAQSIMARRGRRAIYLSGLFSSKSYFSGLFLANLRSSYFSGLFSANVTDGEAPETQDLAGFGENWEPRIERGDSIPESTL